MEPLNVCGRLHAEFLILRRRDLAGKRPDRVRKIYKFVEPTL
jgi:hypothetical protein